MNNQNILPILRAIGYSPKQLIKEHYAIMRYSEHLIERIQRYPTEIKDDLDFLNEKLQKISKIYHVNKKSDYKYVIYIFKKDNYELGLHKELYFIDKETNEEIILNEHKGDVKTKSRPLGGNIPTNKEKIGIIDIKYKVITGILKSIRPN